MISSSLARTVQEEVPADAAVTEPGTPAEPALSDFDLARWGAELLDPDSWGEVLGRYGRTMRLAVALTVTDGDVLGVCHTPQPVWSLTRQGRAKSGPVCAFCLIPDTPCSAVEDALVTRETVYTRDNAGLTHAAIPLILGNRPLGALIPTPQAFR